MLGTIHGCGTRLITMDGTTLLLGTTAGDTEDTTTDSIKVLPKDIGTVITKV
jgi:hypothetical protein